MALAQGQILPGVDPRLPKPEPSPSMPARESGELAESEEDQILVKNFLGFRLEPWAGEGELRQISEVMAIRGDLLVPSPRTLSKKLEAFVGKPLTESALW